MAPYARPIAARRLAAAACTLVATWACGGGDGPAEPPARLAALRLRIDGRVAAPTAAGDTLVEGAESGVSVRGVTNDGRDTTVSGVTLSTSDSAVLALTDVLPNGSFGRYGTAAARGAGRVVLAAQVGGVRGELTVTVLRGEVGQVQLRTGGGAPLASVAVDSLPVRTARGYGATVFARTSGAQLFGRAITWTTSDSAVARVTADGVLDGRREGVVVLRAAADGAADSLRVVVRPPLAARIAFVTAPDSVRVRRSDSVRVVLYDSAGAPIAVRARVAAEPPGGASGASGTVTLADGPTGSAAVVVTGATVGTAQLVASGDGLTVRRALPVVALPQGAPGAYPATVSAVAGTSLLLAARGLDVDGFGLATPVPVSYASTDPAVASVTDAGVVTARAAGTTVIRVTTGATRTDVPVTVLPAGGFSMVFRSARATPLPAALDAALRTAGGAWERAVVGDLRDLRLTLPPGACDVPSVTGEGELTIDDVLIFASADSIDGPGKVLAQAGPCVIRSDGTAAVGRIYVDSADVASLTARGQLAVVLEHELGHVLGIGTLWSRSSLGLVIRNGLDFRYIGTRGQRVSDWWARSPAGGVVLGEANGPGDGHWDEGAFGNELMTPVLNAGVNPLSLLTLEALADLGYTTSAAGAEAYALYAGVPAAARGPLTTAGAAGVSFDRLLAPRWRATGNGRVQALPLGTVR